MTIFIDSGGWMSVLMETDRFHQAGAAYFLSILRTGAKLMTSDYVLDETITRLTYDAGHRKAVEFLQFVRHALDDRALIVRRIDEALWRDAETLFLRYTETRLSFTDCTSFAILANRHADVVFGFDSHFEMMGHILQPKP